MKTCTWGIALVAALVLGSCGGGGSGLVWENHDRTYVSLDARDGVISLVVSTSGTGLWAGDADGVLNGIYARSFFSFETGGISDEAQVDSAVLRIYQEAVVGAPYTDLGALLVDHVDLGPGLDGTDLAGNTLTANIGTLSSSNAIGWMTLDVTAAVQTDVTLGRAFSDFRVYFATNSNTDLNSDQIHLNDGADVRGTGHLPVLEIHYRAPRL